MDINDLNKSQLILLAILLSFVISIATGITTVTLMEQAPESVTVPINRVIQQTVEKIQQVEGKTTVQTVVVKEEDLVVDAIAKNKSASFILTKEVGSNDDEVSAGRAFLVKDKNIVVADAILAPGRDAYYLENESGKFAAEFLNADNAGFSFLKIGEPLKTETRLATELPHFGEFAKMKVGQKILVYGSGITSFIYEGNPNLKINVTNIGAGSMVLNLDGQVIGMALFNEANSFVAIETILAALKNLSL